MSLKSACSIGCSRRRSAGCACACVEAGRVHSGLRRGALEAAAVQARVGLLSRRCRTLSSLRPEHCGGSGCWHVHGLLRLPSWLPLQAFWCAPVQSKDLPSSSPHRRRAPPHQAGVGAVAPLHGGPELLLRQGVHGGGVHVVLHACTAGLMPAHRLCVVDRNVEGPEDHWQAIGDRG